MGVQVSLKDIASGFLSAATHTANNTLIESGFDKALDRTATTNNAMEVDLDMGSNRAINIANGISNKDAVNVEQLNGAIAAAGSGLIAQGRETQLGSDASGQVFTFSGITYTVGGNNLMVKQNGVDLYKDRDYTETSSNSITVDSDITINPNDNWDFYTNIATTNSTTTTSAITHTSLGSEVNLSEYLQNTILGAVSDIQAATLAGVPAVQTLGYYTAGDGGGALYRADTADTSTTDDGFLCIVSGDGVRFKLQYSGEINVKWAGATGDNSTDDTAAILAVWTAASTTDEEIEVVWPTGKYRVTQLDYTGLSTVTNRSAGSAIIFGTDTTSTYEWIVGCDGYNSGSPASSIVSRRFHWKGRFIVNPLSGTTYTTGLKLFSAVECDHEGLSVSGSFSNATVDLQYSYSNSFTQGSYSNSNDGAGGTVYVFKEGNNNNNNNTWTSIRLAGTNDTTDDQVGMWLRGNCETVINSDISAIKEGIRFDAGRGCSSLNNYFEATLNAITIGNESTAPARGVSVVGGYIEVLSNGVGIQASTASYGVQGMSVSGTRFKGVSAGSSRTAIDLGSQAYHLSVMSCDYENIDTDITGTYRKGGGIGALLNYPFEIASDGSVTLNEVFDFGDAIVKESQVPDTVIDSAACSLTTQQSNLVTTGAATPTLADGEDGQIKTIYFKTDGGNAALTPSNLHGGTTITFANVGESATIKFTDGAWLVVSLVGATLS